MKIGCLFFIAVFIWSNLASAALNKKPRLLDKQEITLASSLIQQLDPKSHFVIQQKQSFAVYFENGTNEECWWVNAIDESELMSFLVSKGKIIAKLALDEDYEVDHVSAMDFLDFNHDGFTDVLLILMVHPLAGLDRTALNMPYLYQNLGGTTPTFKTVATPIDGNCYKSNTLSQVEKCLASQKH